MANLDHYQAPVPEDGLPFNEQMANIFLNRVQYESEKARSRWDYDFDGNNTANDWAAYVMEYMSRAAQINKYKDEFAVEQFRENIIKVAGLCLSAFIAIERRENRDLPPRHY